MQNSLRFALLLLFVILASLVRTSAQAAERTALSDRIQELRLHADTQVDRREFIESLLEDLRQGRLQVEDFSELAKERLGTRAYRRLQQRIATLTHGIEPRDFRPQEIVELFSDVLQPSSGLSWSPCLTEAIGYGLLATDFAYVITSALGGIPGVFEYQGVLQDTYAVSALVAVLAVVLISAGGNYCQ